VNIAELRRSIDFARVGAEMHEWMAALYPICRSITGDGVRETLALIKRQIPLTVHEVPSGTKVFDWNVPLRVGSRPARLTGTLFWAPADSGGIPAAAIVALAVLVAVTAALFVATRRVRSRDPRKSAEAF
jgi:hypothetical protein